MNRPDHIRCETCVFWTPYDGAPESDGLCHLKPCNERKRADDFCGEHRDTWPEAANAPLPPKKPQNTP